jgi:acetyl esterase/lipase
MLTGFKNPIIDVACPLDHPRHGSIYDPRSKQDLSLRCSSGKIGLPWPVFTLGILDRPHPAFDKSVAYGSDPQQFAEVRFPAERGRFPLLLVIHGGFWRSEYDLSHMGSFCAALTERNVVTANLEYRRIGNEGGGWPGTFQDVSLACDQLLQLFSSDHRIDVKNASVCGFSAGGHLALWLTSRHRIPESSTIRNMGSTRITRAISLAGVCDLRTAWKQRLGNGIVDQLIGSPDKHPERYLAGSPIELLPTQTEQVLIHGTMDPIVPISQSELFVQKARKLGDNPRFAKLDGYGHFELIDPQSEAWPQVMESILSHLKSD